MNKDEAVRKYEEYIEEHMVYVWKAYQYISKLLGSILKEKNIHKELISNVLNHDNSKYSLEEFEPYRKNFYPIHDLEKENNKDAFDVAWKHHYMNNKHHWNIWALGAETDEECTPMPILYIYEMVIDWVAMGYKFNNTAYDYYNNNRNEIKLHPESRKELETILNKIKECEDNI